MEFWNQSRNVIFSLNRLLVLSLFATQPDDWGQTANVCFSPVAGIHSFATSMASGRESSSMVVRPQV
jgi:hypothetical protein